MLASATRPDTAIPFIGMQAGYSNTSGWSNTFTGYNAGYNTTGVADTFIGDKAGANNTSVAATFTSPIKGSFSSLFRLARYSCSS